jgi:bifunctional oligoribonuclease and PAP phosphatase NrnA
MSDVAEVATALQRCSRVLISVHKNPDGDALGAQLALLLALEKQGKTAVAHNLDPVPEIYRFLPHAGRIKTGRAIEGRFDACVVLDAEPSRTGLFDAAVPAEQLINIDHHITNTADWPIVWLDPSAAATGVMIYKLLRQLGAVIDRDTALCLYTSIFTDTGSFRYSNTSPESMRISAELLEAGADPWLVTENVYESFAFRRLRLLGSVLAGIERSRDGRVAWVVVTNELYKATQTTAEDTDNFVNFVRSAKGVEVAVLFRQTAEAEYKISMRSKGRVDLSSLAVSFGGGGHRNAAGAVLKGTLDEVKARVLDVVIRTLERELGAGANPPE